MPILELATFPGSDAFIADRNIFKKPLERIITAEGQISTHYGIQHQDKRTGYLVVGWETYEHHMKLTERDDYEDIKQELGPSLAASTLDMQHIEFNEDHTAAITAPTTEFATVKLKPGHSKDGLVVQIKRLIEELNRTKVSHLPSVWGESRENSGTFIVAVGWDSAEEHVEAIKAEGLRSIISDLMALADVEVIYTNLVKFKSEA